MNTAASYFRVIGFMILAFFLLEFLVDSGESLAVVKYPIVWLVLGILFFIAIAFEIVAATFHRILFNGLSDEAKARYIALGEKREQDQFGWIKRKYHEMLDSKPMEKEQEIVLDHNYDGIRELDNNLPPWWKYLFYVTIVFGVAYFVYYEMFDGPNQIDEYETEVAQAKRDIAEFKKNNKDLIDATTVEYLDSPSDLAAGKAIYTDNCVACHKDSGGGGIGPNLTDDYWILGGGIKNIYNTISEGGRAGKGMIAWKTDLKPSQIAQVSSYVMTLHGTNPADGKEAEGEIWKDENTTEDKVEVTEDDANADS